MVDLFAQGLDIGLERITFGFKRLDCIILVGDVLAHILQGYILADILFGVAGLDHAQRFILGEIGDVADGVGKADAGDGCKKADFHRRAPFPVLRAGAFIAPALQSRMARMRDQAFFMCLTAAVSPSSPSKRISPAIPRSGQKRSRRTPMTGAPTLRT